MYRARVRLKIVHSPHPCKYTIDYPYSSKPGRNIATNLSEDDYQTDLLKISAFSTPEGKKKWLFLS